MKYVHLIAEKDFTGKIFLRLQKEVFDALCDEGMSGRKS